MEASQTVSDTETLSLASAGGSGLYVYASEFLLD